jgi:hypothetical protein
MELTASAEKLKQALQILQRRYGTAGMVPVPSELLEQTAKIESAQIAKERKDAVLQSVTFRPSGYAVTFDRDAAVQRATLGFEDRVELEDLVAQLSTEGAHLDAEASAISGVEDATLRLVAKGKHFDIEYVVDQPSRAIRITTVRYRQEGDQISLTGDSHA